jgi:hypothetical protein
MDSMESLPRDVQYYLLDGLLDVDPLAVLALAKTCRTFAMVVEAWLLATKRVRLSLFDDVDLRRSKVAYLVARPHCELYCLQRWKRSVV